MPSIQEITGSMLLTDDSAPSIAGGPGASGLEELSESLLIEDAPDGSPILTRAPRSPAGSRPLGSSQPQHPPPAPPARPSQSPRAPSVKPPAPPRAPGNGPSHAPLPRFGGLTPSPSPAPVQPTHASPSVEPPRGAPGEPVRSPAPPKAEIAPAASPTGPHEIVLSPSPSSASLLDEPTNVIQPHPQLVTVPMATIQMPALDSAHGDGYPGGPSVPPGHKDTGGSDDSTQPSLPEADASSPDAVAASPEHARPPVSSLPVTRLQPPPLTVVKEAVFGLAKTVDVWVRARVPVVERSFGNLTPNALLAVIGAAGLIVGIGLVTLIVSLVRGGEPSKGEPAAHGAASAIEAPSSTPAPSSSAPSAEERPAAAASTAAALPLPPPPAPPATTACTVNGAAHVVATNAMLAPGVEVRALGHDVALGFASGDHDAVGLRIDLASFAGSGVASATNTTHARSAESIRRVTPVPPTTPGLSADKGPPGVAIDADRADDALQGRRTLAFEPPLDLGAADGGLAWASHGGPSQGKLWALDGTGNVDALRGSVSGTGADTTTSVAFRRSGAVWLGTLVGQTPPAPKGDLTRIAGLGPVVGSPAIAQNGGVVIASWADRASDKDPWALRWVRFKSGDAPGEPQTFAPPPGGKGEQAMSPSLAAIGGGRFLLVWTEGSPYRHDVRALTIGADGTPVGDPLEVSADGVDAGQGQAAVNAEGAGIVAYLQAVGSAFELAARPITCGP